MNHHSYLFSILLFASTAQGQTLVEWTRQKKTQTLYLQEQVAALKAYAWVAKKGYEIAKDGLSAIGKIKQGDLSQHQGYFNSLKMVNPDVPSLGKAGDILWMNAAIAKACKDTKSIMNSSGEFSTSEISYAREVLDQILQGCAIITGELTRLTENGYLQMSDDERTERIRLLYNDMLDRYRFVQQFGNTSSVLAAQRWMDQNQVRVTKELYGLGQ